MAIALWIIQGLLGLLFIITGSFKLFQNREKVIESGGTWAEDFHPIVVRAIATVELMSGISVIVPRLMGRGHYLTFIGAATIAVIMTGSIFVHIRRGEHKHAAINSVFLLMALFVVYGSWPMTP